LPTGVALEDPRARLFDAAVRILLQAGPGALTSRAVTAEAGVAKGVLHRHFADFDAFLAELILDRIASLKAEAAGLLEHAGTGTVVGNVTAALVGLFEPVAVAVLGLVITRDTVRARLRAAGAARIPLLGEGVTMIAAYLDEERDLGRISAGADADVAALAPTLVGAVHLLFTDREEPRPETAAVSKVVALIMAGVLRET
jgi:AcrR family transcriptional regulator